MMPSSLTDLDFFSCYLCSLILQKDPSIMTTKTTAQRPAPPLASLSEPTVSINRFPSPPPVPMPPFTFPLSEMVASQLSMLDDKHFSFLNGQEYSSPSSSRSSSRKSSTAGLEGGDLAMTPKKHVRVDSRIVVPAITLSKSEYRMQRQRRRTYT